MTFEFWGTYMYQVAYLYIKEEVCTSLNEENSKIILNPRKAILYKELYMAD